MEFQMKIRKSINLQLVLPVQTYSQRFERVARCFSLKSKDRLKFLSLSVLSDYFVLYMFHTFTNHKFVLRFSLSASRVSICIRLVIGGKDNWRIRYRRFLSNQRKHFFQLQRKKPLLVWKNWLFAFLFGFVCETSFVQKCKLSRKPITFYLLRSEMQTSSATGWLLQRDGSFYLTKVFGIDDMPCYLVTPSDNVHFITNKLRPFPH